MADRVRVGRDQAPIDALLDDRHLLDALLEHSPDHIYFKDKESRFVRVSRSLAQWMGLSDPVDAIGRSDDEFFAPEHARKARLDEAEIMRVGHPLAGLEEREIWPDGRVTWVSTTKAPLRDRDGAIIGVFGMSRDITARKAAEELLPAQANALTEQARMLRDLAVRDELTGLLNRRGFSDAATQALQAARAESLHVMMFFVDLDGLKQINDRYGHAVGDSALVAVADALRSVAAPRRIAGRVGGDEFCLLESAPSGCLFLTKQALQTAIAAAASALGLPELSASIGCVDAPADADLIYLVARSDERMYARKPSRGAGASGLLLRPGTEEH